MTGRKGLRGLLIGLLILGGGAAGLFAWQNGRHAGPSSGGAESAEGKPAGALAAEPQRAVAVTAAPVSIRSVQRAVGAVGGFFGFEEVTVMAEVPGRVARIYHDVGDLVRPGEVLLEIDATDYELGYEETLRALQLDVSRILRPLPPDADFEPSRALAILAELDLDKLPAVVRAREQERNAQVRLQRAQQLAERNSMSDEEYQQRSTDYEVALANLTQAQLDAQAIVAGIKHRLVLLKTARRKLELTKVCVPTPTEQEGWTGELTYAVVERKVSEGEMVKDSPGSSTAAFELVLDSVLKLRANVPERFSGQVQKGQEAAVRVDAYPDRTFAGRVMRINPRIDRTSRTFEVEIYVDNAARELKAGGFAKVDILTRVDPQAWTVPVEALVTYAGSTKIFVLRGGQAHAVPVAAGLEGRGWVELLRSGSLDLRLDDQVIVSGQEKLAEGVAVTVRSGRAPEPPAGQAAEPVRGPQQEEPQP